MNVPPLTTNRLLLRPIAQSDRAFVVRRSDDAPIGTCGFHTWSRQHQRAEIGYDLSPAY
jgi:ribosomal-protein-alanine N-acetyltransferase